MEKRRTYGASRKGSLKMMNRERNVQQERCAYVDLCILILTLHSPVMWHSIPMFFRRHLTGSFPVCADICRICCRSHKTSDVSHPVPGSWRSGLWCPGETKARWVCPSGSQRKNLPALYHPRRSSKYDLQNSNTRRNKGIGSWHCGILVYLDHLIIKCICRKLYNNVQCRRSVV